MRRIARTDPEAGTVIALVAASRRVAVGDLLQKSRCCAQVAAARQLAMYLTHVMLGRTLTEVGILFGRDRTTVSYACHLVEDLRDRPDFEAEVGRLEAAIRTAAPARAEEAGVRHVAC